MSIFRRTPAVQTSDEPIERRPPRLWADNFGMLATRALQILLVLAVAALLVFALRQVTIVTIAVLIALILASAFAPPMEWMRRHHVPPLLATIITLLSILIVLGLVGWLLFVAVRHQWSDLASQAQQGLEEVSNWIQTLPFAPTDEQLDNLRSTVISFVTSAQFGSGAVASVTAVASFITGLILMVTVLFFFLKDGPKLWEFVLRPFRGAQYERARRIGDKTVSTLGAYVRGTATIALIDAVGIGIGLVVLQVPLAVPLTLLVFVLAFIPIVGATLAGILAALVALVSNGLVNALIVVGVIVLVEQLEGDFLQPVVMGRSIRLHPLVVLIALTIGTLLSGVIGAVLAVPLTAVAWGIVQVWNGDNAPARWALPRRAKQSSA